MRRKGSEVLGAIARLLVEVSRRLVIMAKSIRFLEIWKAKYPSFF